MLCTTTLTVKCKRGFRWRDGKCVKCKRGYRPKGDKCVKGKCCVSYKIDYIPDLFINYKLGTILSDDHLNFLPGNYCRSM